MSRSSRGFGGRGATGVDVGSGCGRAIPGRCHRRRGRRGARALAADLKHRRGVSRKVAELFRVAWGLEVTASGLCQADERLAEKAEPVYQELVEALRDSVAVHADETGWRVGGQGAGLWVFTGPRGTVSTIDGRWSHEVVVEVLGPGFSGVWVTDCPPVWDTSRPTDAKQVPWNKLRRRQVPMRRNSGE